MFVVVTWAVPGASAVRNSLRRTGARAQASPLPRNAWMRMPWPTAATQRKTTARPKILHKSTQQKPGQTTSSLTPFRSRRRVNLSSAAPTTVSSTAHSRSSCVRSHPHRCHHRCESFLCDVCAQYMIKVYSIVGCFTIIIISSSTIIKETSRRRDPKSCRVHVVYDANV